MIRRTFSVSSVGRYFAFDTLEYAYPSSRVKLTYDVGKGMKVHYGQVYYDESGRLTFYSKQEISKKAQDDLMEYTFVRRVLWKHSS